MRMSSSDSAYGRTKKGYGSNNESSANSSEGVESEYQHLQQVEQQFKAPKWSEKSSYTTSSDKREEESVNKKSDDEMFLDLINQACSACEDQEKTDKRQPSDEIEDKYQGDENLHSSGGKCNARETRSHDQEAYLTPPLSVQQAPQLLQPYAKGPQSSSYSPAEDNTSYSASESVNVITPSLSMLQKKRRKIEVGEAYNKMMSASAASSEDTFEPAAKKRALGGGRSYQHPHAQDRDNFEYDDVNPNPVMYQKPIGSFAAHNPSMHSSSSTSASASAAYSAASSSQNVEFNNNPNLLPSSYYASRGSSSSQQMPQYAQQHLPQQNYQLPQLLPPSLSSFQQQSHAALTPNNPTYRPSHQITTPSPAMLPHPYEPPRHLHPHNPLYPTPYTYDQQFPAPYYPPPPHARQPAAEYYPHQPPPYYNYPPYFQPSLLQQHRPQQYQIINVTDADVLCGRGGATNSYAGNKYFRSLVKIFQLEYLKAKKKDKPSVADKIVEVIKDKGGRFLIKDKITGNWTNIGDYRAREKTSQALREGAPELRKKQTPSTLPQQQELELNTSSSSTEIQQITIGNSQVDDISCATTSIIGQQKDDVIQKKVEEEKDSSSQDNLNIDASSYTTSNAQYSRQIQQDQNQEQQENKDSTPSPRIKEHFYAA